MSALVALLPFEPRTPTLPILGFQVTVLEAVAGVVLATVGLVHRSELLERIRARPLPLLFLTGYAVVHVASAALAHEHRDHAWKFTARMATMAACGFIVAAAPAPARRRALVALVAAGCVVAVLAVAEGSGVRALDGLLAHFRETPFNVGGSRRATAGSEYPNLAAAFLMYALLAWSGLSQGVRAWLGFGIPALLSAGLLFTYSRGALIAAAAGLLASLVASRRRPALARGPLTALIVLLVASSVFAASGEVFRLRLESEGGEAWYAARYEPAETSYALRPREARRARVRVTNVGLKTWSRREAFHLSYHWYDRDTKTLTDGGRTELPEDVPRGASVLLDAAVVAPERPGRYLLIWDMVHEHTTWFSGQGVRAFAVYVLVGQPGRTAPPATEGPETELGWRPGRRELWRLALAMWRAHPVLGVGPDNFRWLYGRYAGRAFWDTRVFANNTLIEAAATTGSLGALALALTLASALGAAWRAMATAPQTSAPSALALLGLSVGLAAHGVVDYVLAFTGHYLFMGFLVGSISARDPDLG